MNPRLAKLTISLALDVVEERASAGDQEFELPRKSSGMGNDVILQRLIDAWPGGSEAIQFGRSDGSVLAVSELSSRLKSGEGWIGPLEANGIKFHVAELPSMRQTIITIEETVVGSAGSWDEWVRPFLDQDSFIQAWTADVEYDFWQNASDTLEYETNGREYTHLRLISNGLPFPLTRDIIDTSQNPGRVEIRQEYIEAIGSELWVGKKFLRAIGRQGRIHDLANLGFLVTDITPNVVKIFSSDHCFNSCDNEKQKKLRQALYGHS